MEAVLALEDGLVFRGKSFGATGEAVGEVVFNTSMTGYQEILTDPSYKGQIVTMTYPLIGNYGITETDFESARPYAEGFIVKELSGIVSNWQANGRFEELLIRHKVVGIEGIDTRALTKHIRQAGAMKAVISTIDLDEKSLVKKAKDSPGLIGRDLVKEVTCTQVYQWRDEKSMADESPLFYSKVKARQKQDRALPAEGVKELSQNARGTYRVVALDFGIKFNILRNLAHCSCQVTVVPAVTSADEILAMKPDGLFLSNGPGDPEGVPYAVETVKKLLGKLPIFGICLGHQILGLAFGGKTYKLKFGHHGGNQPVMDLATGKVEITAQNHGFAVDIDSLPEKEIRLTHLNLNDRTVEGMEHTKLPIFSVQYHPEAGPGPHDATYLFDRFIENMQKVKKT